MSAATTPTASFRATQVTKAAPESLPFLEVLQLAVAGGEATYDFFAGDYGALQRLANQISTGGDAAWTNVATAAGLNYDFLDATLPASYVRDGDATLVVQFHASTQVMGEATTDYKQAGIATTYLVTDQGPVDVIVSYVEKLGPPVAGAALLPAITAILGAVKTFFQQVISKAFSAAEGGATDAAEVAADAAEEAGEEAAVDGEIIADELAISIEFGPLAIVGIAIAIITLVVSVILFFLAKTMTCFVKVYNFTDEEITLRLCHQYDLEVKQEPKTGVLPAMGVPPAPPGVTALSKVIYRADYTFLNSDDLKGLGAVIQATGSASPSDPTGFPGLTAMLDVPSVGDNSIYVSMDGSTDCGTVWSNFAGTFTKVAKSTCSGVYRIYMATNQLRHKSKDPITGADGYFYEFIVVVEKDGFFIGSSSD